MQARIGGAFVDIALTVATTVACSTVAAVGGQVKTDRAGATAAQHTDNNDSHRSVTQRELRQEEQEGSGRRRNELLAWVG